MSPRGADKEAFVYDDAAATFYDLFEQGLAWLGVARFGFKPYSLRRGGATAHFRRHRSLELTLDRGRWSSARVGRIYVNDGIAKETDLNITEVTRRRISTLALAMMKWLGI